MGKRAGLYRVGSTAAAAGRWAGRALERCSNVIERGVMDSAHGCAVEGSSSPLRCLSDLPSAFSAMAAGRGAGRHLVGLVRRPDGAREIGSEPVSGRRLVQRGKKGGDRIGPTRCGKGARSWQLQTAAVLLSRSGLRALRRMNPLWSNPRLSNAKSAPCPSA